MDAMIIIIIFVLISIFISFAIGANDETFSTVYGSRTLMMREILIVATILALSGAFILGRGVSETVGKDLLTFEVSNT
ncbi:MAG: hypothetical protein EU541_06650, partial [Promethearchaeota archaeon]